ncbi:hypothetical protein Aca07nite_73360 [Actinoplanes capillaceus]|uniref:Uncharacterized protein n=1 Tax=Actinoplanes campanulatus TaxID=113559 RepID=A0ABQ3WUT6_9ACTN|nr:hypothetical protein Aca07nite_73360 [Actinoplanes capillaceus]
MSPRPGDQPVPRAENRRPVLGDTPEGFARFMPVPELLSDDAQIMGDVQHERISVPEPPLPGRVGVLQHPAGAHRIVGPQIDPGELPLSGEHVRFVLPELLPPELDSPFKQHLSRVEVARGDQTTGPLEGRSERRRLRHVRHAARSSRPTPHPIPVTVPTPASTPPGSRI